MCNKQYDWDCLDGIDDILQSAGKSTCGGSAEAQVFPAHNNNTQVLPRRQSKQLQLVRGLQQTDETGGGVQSGKSGFEGLRKTAPPTESLCQDSTKLLSSSASRAVSIPTGSMSSWRNENLMTCMLITANVGTIFEESALLELWFEQLKSYLTKIKPQLVAIHCQEVGGKNYETSMKDVSSFTDKILGDDKIIGDYSRVRIFLDQNFECLEKFTALGSLYLVHDSVANVKLYNFKAAQYDTVEGRDIYAVLDDGDSVKSAQPPSSQNSIEQESKQRHKSPLHKTAEHVEKIKFPRELFPECRWSRKGFMRTRWLFNDCQPLDLVNIHLFHDASNLVAMKTTPSPYARNRQKALEFAMRKISEPLSVADSNNRGQASQNLTINNKPSTPTSSPPSWQDQVSAQQQNQVPMFIFGDFNFRLNTSKVIQRITEGISPVVKRNADGDEVLEIVYHRKTSECAREPICNECDRQRSPEKTLTTDNEDNDIEIEDEEGGVLMTVGKKLFDYRNLDETFRATKNTEWLLELDNELDSFKSQLHEFKISFSPSYPFKEDQSGGYSYMKTRCPAWCDRILFNEAGYRLISAKTSSRSAGSSDAGAEANMDHKKRIEFLQDQGDVIYRLMGNSVPMGDHKPVLLFCHLNISQQQQNQHLPSV